jgi:predicted Rossmann-fold nucleotide-binding protein
VAEDHPHYQQAKQLSQDVAKLFGGSTTWSGAGAGFMGAVSSGAMEAGFPVAGFMIEREGGKWVGAVS